MAVDIPLDVGHLSVAIIDSSTVCVHALANDGTDDSDTTGPELQRLPNQGQPLLCRSRLCQWSRACDGLESWSHILVLGGFCNEALSFKQVQNTAFKLGTDLRHSGIQLHHLTRACANLIRELNV